MRTRVVAMLVAAAASVLPTAASHAVAAHPRAAAPTSLRQYLTLAGDQIVTVPNGTYSGGNSISAPHPATDGPFEGWLVLQAETRHGVTVSGDLILQEGTSRVLFVGFDFVNTRLFVDGEHIAFWYTDHVFPDADWYASGRPVPRQFHVRAPARDISLLGSDFHDGVATPITMDSVVDIEVTGVTVYDIAEPAGSDPEDRSHVNVIGVVGGATSDLAVSHSYFRGGRLNHQTDFGDVVRLSYTDVWYTGAFGAAFQFNATNGNRIIGGTRVNIRSWGHLGAVPRDRRDNIDGISVPVGSRPDRVDVIDDGVVMEPPPDGAVDPATQWREQHPYDSWPAYFSWEDAGGG